MQRLESYSEESALHEWVDDNTRQLDLVASWETLCDIYDVLQFKDPLTDTVRLEEFKWIIKETNKFLTRIRKTLLNTRNMESAISALKSSFVPTGKITLENRKALAYHKLRQQWIMTSLNQLRMMKQELDQMMEEVNGRSE